eukprot:TRINITY_DN17793_c0_g2_i1.p2 TRINITY_DN17793_c0_g2~~TRINITY_DN17793_c0_g2_i1.p2  ORF type:complete len:234 (+),score=76.27 TRINITY_DN17793_c0_g2_i1:121-822(+)
MSAKKRQAARPPPVPEDNPPQPTLYIRNISERVGKEELTKSLWQAFHQFGEIVDIYSRPRVLRCKGQAWVCFKDAASAANALRERQNFSFYDKPLCISFARVKSDVIAKADGTFVERRKRKKKKGAGGKDAPKRRRFEEKPDHLQSRPVGGAGQLPNRILFVENVPEDRSDVENMLQMLFQNFPGFKEVRMVPGNRGVAFVEFQDEGCAGQSMSGLQGFNMAGSVLRISFAKR